MVTAGDFATLPANGNSALLLTPERALRIAWLRTLAMANSAFWGLFFNYILCLPSAGTLSIMGPMLSTTGAMGEVTRARRTMRVGGNIFSVGVLQYLQNNLTEHRIYTVLVVFILAMLVHKLYFNAQASSAIMVGAVLDLKFTPYHLTADVLLSLTAMLPLICWGYLLLDRALLGSDESTGFIQSRALTTESAFRRSLAFTIGYYLTKATATTESHWLLFTIGLAYMTGEIGDRARRIAELRTIWALPGLAFAVIFLDVTSFQNYQFEYATVFIGGLAFFISYYWKNYSLYYLIFLIMITMELNFLSGHTHNFDNSFNYVFQSTVMIALGAGIVFLLEWRDGTPRSEHWI